MVRINLLPVRVSKKKEAGKQQLVLFVVLLAAGLVGNFLWTSNRRSDLEAHQRRLAKTRADIETLDRIIGEVKSIREQQTALKEKLGVLDRLKEGRSGPVRMLDELSTVIPRRVWITKMTQKDAGVIFEGTGVNIDDVSAFMSALKQSRHFKTVELKKTETKSAGTARVVDFVVETAVDYGGGQASATAPATGAGG